MAWFVLGSSTFGAQSIADSRKKEYASQDNEELRCVNGGETFCLGIGEKSGRVYGWGSAFYGELGSQTEQIRVEPHVLFPESDLRFQRLACGWNFALAVTENGQVYAWGMNHSSQVSAQREECIVVPYQIPIRVSVRSVAAGHAHSLALDEAGHIWSWGRNAFGQLGLPPDIETISEPRYLPCTLANPIASIAAGYAHSAAISRSGELYTFGWGLYYQLGHGDTENAWKLERVEALCGIPNGEKGHVKIARVSCGTWHTAVCTSTGDVYLWGWGQDGQLGPGSARIEKLPHVVGSDDELLQTRLENIVDVQCGARHTTILCRDGSVYHWGKLAQEYEDVPERVNAIACGHSNTFLLRTKS